MKKFVFILLALLTTVALSAQVAKTKVIAPNTFGSIVSPTPAATMYKITGTTAEYVLFEAAMNYPTTQDFVIRLDSVSGNHTAVAIVVAGQKSALKGDWTTIATSTWYGTTKDTVIILSNATANRYQNFKYTYTGTGTGVTKLTNSYLKLWLE